MSGELRAGIYRHWKGPLYQVLFVGQDSSNSSDGRVLVTYVPLQLDGAHTGYRIRHREVDEFLDTVHTEDGSTCLGERCTRVVGRNFATRFTYLGPELTEDMSEARP